MTTREYMAKKLKELRNGKGMSVDEVGERVGKSGKTISAWEVGRGQPDADKLIELCQLFGVSISEFYQEVPGALAAIPGPSCQMPLVGRIAAGTPREAINQSGESVEVLITVRDAHPRGFWLSVAGNSMNRLFPEGTLVLIDPDMTVRDGDVAVVFVNGDDATLKRVYFEGDAIRLHPESYDPEYPDRLIDQSDPDAPEVRIVGRAVTYMAPSDWRA